MSEEIWNVKFFFSFGVGGGGLVSACPAGNSELFTVYVLNYAFFFYNATLISTCTHIFICRI